MPSLCPASFRCPAQLKVALEVVPRQCRVFPNPLCASFSDALRVTSEARVCVAIQDTTAEDIADIAKIGALFKELKGRTDIYLENQTLIAYTKQAIKNKNLAKALEKAFPDSIPQKDWAKIEEGDEGEGKGGKGKA
jgi:hypothetical protein